MRKLGRGWLGASSGLTQAEFPRRAQGLCLAGRRSASRVSDDDLDRDHPTVARAGRREARADSVGPNSASGRTVNGLRAGTR